MARKECKNSNTIYYSPEMVQGFSFYQIPKWLFSLNLSNEAKILYTLLLDRYKLSLKNGWIDSDNRTYMLYKKEDAAEDLGIGKTKIYEIFKELKSNNLIDDIRVGQGRPNMLYLKALRYVNSQQGSTSNKDNQTFEKQSSRRSPNEELNNRNLNTNNNDFNNNDISNSTSTSANSTNCVNDLFNEKTLVAFDDDYEMFVNDKQYKEINELISMIGTHQIDSTKNDLFKFLKKIYDEKKQTFIINEWAASGRL